VSLNPHNPLEELIEEGQTTESEPTAYELYRIDMDAKFSALDSEDTLKAWQQARRSGFRGAIWDDLVHSLLPIVPHVCGKLQLRYGRPNKSQWDDCIQAGNLAVLLAIRSWSPETGVKLSTRAYTYVARDVSRQLDLLESDGVSYENIPDSDDGGEFVENVERSIDFRVVRDNVANLTLPQQRVVNLLLSGRTIAEAAEVMGVTRQAAHALHERAIEELRRHVLT
jgi:RNA polymerase sigma factor (sigma-70 family)